MRIYKLKVYKNERFFANIQWLLYKYFHKKRNIPCGRSKENKSLCCMQPFDVERVYFSEDKTEVYCKVCNSCRIRSNCEINMDDPWRF